MSIKYSTTFKEPDWLTQKLNEHAKIIRQMPPMESFEIAAMSQQQRIGGLNGLLYYDCLYIDQLWVNADFRGQRIGTTLVEQAHRLATQRDCRFAHVCTMEWEAQPFYKKLGYAVEYIREGYTDNTSMILLRRSLINSPHCEKIC